MIQRWARHQLKRSKSATDFAKALDEVGLEAGMTREDFKAMLGKMREQLSRA